MNNIQLSDFRRRLRRWFHHNRRDLPWRRSSDPYTVWVSEVMLQQTQVNTVVPYFERFVEKYPDVRTLASAELQDILKSWEKMGYYARARNLHAAARVLANNGLNNVPPDLDAFRELPGVGDYIAAAVFSIARDHPVAVVDGNVKRVLSRLFLIDLPISTSAANREFKGAATRLLDRRRAGDFNQAMMELGATLCRPKRPLCDRCPVSPHCEAFPVGRQAELPVRARRRAVPKYHVAIGIISKDRRILITQRQPTGHLGGLWEFPGGKVRPGESPQDACAREIEEEVNLCVEVTDYLIHIEHAYSHFKIGVDVYACTYTAGDVKLQGPADYRWILLDEIDEYPFPGANHKFLDLVKQRLRDAR
ncbi:MAG: A/G-specific adenine glycosylase [Candidatus Krumholzibacteria bacterium]|nr:A/G-specific adenine glycosylase [Candidatus Krumholzibacteria bacterium]